MHNADGALTPVDRQQLEEIYRRELGRQGIAFDRLYTVTNVPLNRYRSLLEETQSYVAYMERLAAAFSPPAVEDLVCRSLISVGLDGRLYDCDFNQVLGRPMMSESVPLTIFDARPEDLVSREINFGAQCFGCTAGGGSN
jgi:radical SAM/Cys-rich protein